MSYKFEQGDYIFFKRIVQPEKKFGYKPGPNGRAIVTPQIPEQVLPQGGEGQIIKLSKAQKKVLVDRTKTGQPIYQKFTVARVASGMGVVTAILDDATLAAKPLTMDLGIEATDPSDAGTKMYDTDSKGHA